MVAPHLTNVRWAVDLEAVGVLIRHRTHRRRHVLDHGLDAELLEEQLHLAGLDLREVEHIVDQSQEVPARGVDLPEVGDKFRLTQVLDLFL